MTKSGWHNQTKWFFTPLSPKSRGRHCHGKDELGEIELQLISHIAMRRQLSSMGKGNTGGLFSANNTAINRAHWCMGERGD